MHYTYTCVSKRPQVEQTAYRQVVAERKGKEPINKFNRLQRKNSFKNKMIKFSDTVKKY